MRRFITNVNIKKTAFSAVMVALAFALSKIKIIPMPLGGSVTLFSMLVISLPGYFFGIKFGFSSALIYSFFKLLFGGYVYTLPQALLDYIFSYTAFAVTGFFYKKNNIKYLIIGYLFAIFIRFIMCCISGYIFFAEYTPESWNPIVYNVAYNGAYIFTEGFITIALLFMPYVNNNLSNLKEKLCK